MRYEMSATENGNYFFFIAPVLDRIKSKLSKHKNKKRYEVVSGTKMGTCSKTFQKARFIVVITFFVNGETQIFISIVYSRDVPVLVFQYFMLSSKYYSPMRYETSAIQKDRYFFLWRPHQIAKKLNSSKIETSKVCR